MCLLAAKRGVVGETRAGGETSIPGALGARILHMGPLDRPEGAAGPERRSGGRPGTCPTGYQSYYYAIVVAREKG